MENNTNTAPEVEASEQYMSEEEYYLMAAPIAQFANYAGVDIDEAVAMRVAAARPKLEITVRPTQPQGNLYGFARINIGGVIVNDFKIVENKNGELFVGMPSKPDGKGGYRNTVFVDKDFRDEFNAAVIAEYHATVEKAQEHAAAIAEKPRMTEQMAKAGKQAAQHNASRPAPAKGARDKSAEL